MSIVDPGKCADYISNWIKDYATKAGAKSLVLGLSGGIDSALVALLCQKTRIPLVCVNMPCHSSPAAFERASQFAFEKGINLFKADLSVAYEIISSQFKSDISNIYSDNKPAWDDLLTQGSLRSGLRAPTLSYLAHACHGIIMGTGNRSEDHITRYYAKIGDGNVDISPIADLFKGEVYELFQFLASQDGAMKPGAKSIYDATPSADLWGSDSGQEDEKELGISYNEVEWADREDDRTVGIVSNPPGLPRGIILSDTDPSRNSAWLGYTARQKEVIAKMWQMEKITRHKANPNLPVCEVRKVPGLVR